LQLGVAVKINSLVIAVIVFFVAIFCSLLFLREPTPANASALKSESLRLTANVWEQELSSALNNPSKDPAIIKKWWKVGSAIKDQFPPKKWSNLESAVQSRQWIISGDSSSALGWMSNAGASMGFRLSPSVGDTVLLSTESGAALWICPESGCTITASFGKTSLYFSAVPPHGVNGATSALGVSPLPRLERGMMMSNQLVWHLPSVVGGVVDVPFNTVGWDNALLKTAKMVGEDPPPPEN
jgi:hypothetical protein